ncbi:MAG: hypothetical protein ABSB33_11015 [Tepidisphaeraceae bacterium]|jgi:hypothetical protein
MRMAVGLGGLLVTIGVIAWIMGKVILPYDQASTHAYQQAQVTLNQISGRDENGANIETTYSVFADTRNDGKLQDLQVTQLAANSPLAHFFGLQKDDVISACIDGHTVRTEINGLTDERAGKDAIWDAYTTQGQLVVQRGDQQLTLPIAKTQPTPNRPAPSPTAAAAQNQNAQRTEQQQEGKSNNGSESGSMDEIRQRLHALPTY